MMNNASNYEKNIAKLKAESIPVDYGVQYDAIIDRINTKQQVALFYSVGIKSAAMIATLVLVIGIYFYNGNQHAGSPDQYLAEVFYDNYQMNDALEVGFSDPGTFLE